MRGPFALLHFKISNASKSKVDQCSARNLRVCCPFLWEACLK